MKSETWSDGKGLGVLLRRSLEAHDREYA